MTIEPPKWFKEECNLLRKELEIDKKRRKWKPSPAPYNKIIIPQDWRGNFNKNWKGDNVGYTALHAWIRRHLPLPDVCAFCRNTPYDLANITGIYNRDFKNWKYLCRLCHKRYDYER